MPRPLASTAGRCANGATASERKAAPVWCRPLVATAMLAAFAARQCCRGRDRSAAAHACPGRDRPPSRAAALYHRQSAATAVLDALRQWRRCPLRAPKARRADPPRHQEARPHRPGSATASPATGAVRAIDVAAAKGWDGKRCTSASTMPPGWPIPKSARRKEGERRQLCLRTQLTSSTTWQLCFLCLRYINNPGQRSSSCGAASSPLISGKRSMTSYRVTFFKNLVNSNGHQFKCPQGTIEISAGAELRAGTSSRRDTI